MAASRFWFKAGFDHMVQMMQTSDPMKVTIITGYLGAGKTTLINRLLREAHGQRLMVLVNDFGEISLDLSLIVNQSGDVIALANGCMCCQIGGDLFRVLNRILDNRADLDGLVIETSGVADPGKISAIALAEPELMLAGVVGLVDACNISRVYEDPLLSDTIIRQLRAADLLIVTKSDIASSEQAEATRAVMKRHAGDVPVFEGEASTALLLDSIEIHCALASAPGRSGAASPDAASHDHDVVPFASWSWSGPNQFDEADLRAFSGREDLGIYRLKGTVRLTGGGAVRIQLVGTQCDWTPIDPYEGQSAIVAIGRSGDFDVKAIDLAWQQIVTRCAVG